MAFSTASLLVLKRLELRCKGVISSGMVFDRHIQPGSAIHKPGSVSWAKTVRQMSSSPALRASLKDRLETTPRALKEVAVAGMAKDLAKGLMFSRGVSERSHGHCSQGLENTLP